MLKVCYFGTTKETFSDSSNNALNLVIKRGLQKNGVIVQECSAPNNLKLIKRFIKLFSQYLKYCRDCDLILVAEFGQTNVFLAKLISLFHKKPIIFNPIISLYDSYVLDRKIFKKNSFSAKKCFYLDKWSFSLADLVLTDTLEHLNYFREFFNLKREKLKASYIGVDSENFYPQINEKNKNDTYFKVFFYGTFHPAHGTEYIIKAANLLKNNKDIKFELLGKGQELTKIKDLTKNLNLSNVSFHDPIEYHNLPEKIATADVCLGLLGNTDKAKRAIPSKVYESMAMKKAVITGDSPAIREIFQDKKHILLCNMADPKSLAESIIRLKQDKILREHIATEGYQRVKDNFSIESVGKKTKILILEVIDKYKNKHGK